MSVGFEPTLVFPNLGLVHHNMIQLANQRGKFKAIPSPGRRAPPTRASRLRGASDARRVRGCFGSPVTGSLRPARAAGTPSAPAPPPALLLPRRLREQPGRWPVLAAAKATAAFVTRRHPSAIC